MLDNLRLLLCRALLVPPEPAAPFGSPESVRVFRAGRNYYRYRLAVWALTQVGALLGILTAAYTLQGPMSRAPKVLYLGWQALEVLAAVALVLLLPATFLIQKLDFEMRWYIVTDRSLRIREGIWRVSEATMTFANIQQIAVAQGPLQRLLGLADVTVASAGGGAAKGEGESGKSSGHVASFEGVDNADQIRDLIVERLRLYRDAGLGDPDDRGQVSEIDAAKDLLAAARELRAAI